MPNPSPRRGADPRPYPGAPSRTRPHHARPGTRRSTGSRSARAAAAAAIPCSVWAPATPVDPTLVWPTGVVRQITTAFSHHRARVGLLPWPTPDTTPSDAEGPALDEQAGAALAVIDKLGRTGILNTLPEPAPSITTTGASAPFWAPLIAPDTHHPEPVAGPFPEPTPEAAEGPVAELDLIITSCSPGEAGQGVSDLVALHAARRLRAGGTLAVLTHSDQQGGELRDPTGVVVAAGQNADLLYLQHLVVLHTPLHRHPFTAPPEPHQVRGHRRAHSDLLVFAQPVDHTRPEEPR